MSPSQHLPLFLLALAIPAFPQAHASAPDPQSALDQLLAGNHRYTSGTCQHPRQSVARRSELAKGQHPLAVVLSCSDSRVPPEILFDQGLGDVFVVRVAGNTADDAAIGSIEYAVEHLGTHLVIVLGHGHCGAVEAALKGGEAPGHLPAILTPLRPALAEAKSMPGDQLDDAVRANARLVAAKLRTTRPILDDLARKHTVSIVPAYYDLDTGKVTVLK